MAAGYDCSGSVQDDNVGNAAESGNCPGNDVFSTYDTDTGLQTQIGQSKANNEMLEGAGLDASTILVGPNWLFSMAEGSDLAAMQSALGGTGLTASDGLSEPETTEPETTEDPTPTFNGKAKDFTIHIKTREKKCFGSAGCNVTFKIDPSYVGTAPLPDSGLIEVTYKVTGGEDGPQVNTFSIDGEGTAHFDSEETISTSSSHRTLKAKVTDVEYDADGEYTG